MVRMRAGVVTPACLIAGTNPASTFNIVHGLPVAPTETQSDILVEAESFWEFSVTGYRSGIAIDALKIEVGAFDLDGPDGIPAEASILDASAQEGFTPPRSFSSNSISAGAPLTSTRDETWRGGPSALMTGLLDPSLCLSRTTVASFRNLGYTMAPVPLPAGIWLSLGGLALPAALRRSRRLEPEAADGV